MTAPAEIVARRLLKQAEWCERLGSPLYSTLLRQTAAGQATTPDNPLAWLRFEPAGDVAEVRLQLWPGSKDRLLARSGFHGKQVLWLARDN